MDLSRFGETRQRVRPEAWHGRFECLEWQWGAWSLTVLLLILAPGCQEGGPSAPEEPEEVGVESDVEAMRESDLMQIPRSRLRDELRTLEAQASRAEASVEAVPLLRRAAVIARVLALREEDGSWLDRARQHLREASLRGSLRGACDAAIEWAELEARDRGALAEAYAVAYRTTRRFEGRAEHAGCLRRAREMRRVLHPYRPDPGVLAVIDADPTVDDPSAHRDQNRNDPWSAWAELQSDAVGAILEDASLYGLPTEEAELEQGRVVRCVFRLDQTVSFAGGEVERGDGMRYYFDLSSTRPATEMAELREVDRGGIRRVGWEPLPDGGVRAFVDTRGDLLAQTFVMTDPYRLVVDLEARPTSAASEIGEQRAPVDLIVLDPGHGGLDYGARYEGMKESLLALDITERVADQLRSRLPHARVAMTRTRDVMVSLEERIAFANSVQADLFVSIHLNAADEPVMNGGVATFVLDTENDQQAVRLAARENGSSTESVTGLQRILAGLHRDEQVASSRLAASFLQREIVIAGRRVIPRLPDRGVKSALFYVLVGARMPAVLVEASFLTQPEEARQLRTARYRQVLAEGIATGIVSYARR